jgi:hypothetical protein
MKSLTELNTFSAQSLAYDDQGTGAQTLADRYQINGLLDTARPVMENIEKLCSAAGSWLSYDIHEGKWGVVINTTGTSVASFDDTNILGSISVSGTGINELYNSVKVEFPHRELRDSADFVTIEIPDEDRNANEEDNTLNLTYDTINEPVQAQLLGLIELKQSRIDLAIAFQTDFSNINVKAGDLISVTNARFGFNAKLFRVITSSEIQDDDGAIRIEITALEYDANVYSTADLFRFTRTDENGIITIGSIGVPGTPQVTKFEIDSRPRIVIETTAPTGVVEGIEYWLTEDVNLAEANRSYRLIAVEKPAGGGVFTSGQQITADYDSITTGDFIVKTRGFNATTTGPFSTPSGIVDFNPKQTTDAIGPNTQSISATGQILTLLAVNALMKSVDGLFSNDTASTSSLFKKVFDLLKDTTGNDLLATQLPVVTSVNPSSGSTTGTTAVTIFGSRFSGATSVTFDGTTATSVVVVNDGTITAVTPANSAGPASVIVNVPGGSNGSNSFFTYVAPEQPALPVPVITSINPNFGPFSGGTSVTLSGSNLTSATSVTFDGRQLLSLVAVNSSTITGITPEGDIGGANIVVTTPIGTNAASGLFTYVGSASTLKVITFYPPDRGSFVDPLLGISSDTAPTSGSYFIVYGTNTTLNEPFYSALSKGSGNVKLYKSDGTLVETLTAAQLNINNNVVELPFATRDYGTDYYILMDQGVITYCNAVNTAITTGGFWNFNTPLYDVAAYSVNSTAPTSMPQVAPLLSNVSSNGYQLILSYTTNIIAGTGNIYVYKESDNSLALTIPIANVTINGPTLTLPSLKDILQYGESYYLNSDFGYIQSYITIDCFFSSVPAAALQTQGSGIGIPTIRLPEAFALTKFIVDSTPFAGNLEKVNPQTNIGLVFNKNVTFTNTGTITIYNSAGAVHQAIPVTTNFNANKTNELIWIGDDPTTSTVTTNTVWINPTKDMTLGETYYVLATPTCVRSSQLDDWTGLSNVNTVRFKIDPGPTATVADVTNSSDGIEMTFDRNIVASNGTISVLSSGGTVLDTINGDDPSIIIS